MKKTKIDWCDCTINPVVGCPRGCEYCYARKLNTRFKWIPDFSKPQFFPERLKEFEGKKPKSIFVNSMSDIEFWEEEWEAKIRAAIIKNPQHKYIVLTKGVMHFWDKLPNSIYNVLTATTQKELERHKNQWSYSAINIEPILEPIDLSKVHTSFKGEDYMIIIGAETGNRKGKVIPQKQWIDDIVKQADERKVKVFMKESLRQLMGKDFRQDRLIWEVSK